MKFFISKCLYPLFYLSCLPTFWLFAEYGKLSPIAAMMLTISVSAIFTFAGEVTKGTYSRRRRGWRTLQMDFYYFVFVSAFSVVCLPLYVPLGAIIGNALGTSFIFGKMQGFSSLLCAVVIMDFLSYWIHRIQHKLQTTIFWTSHSIHHGLPRFDFILGAQAHIVDGLIGSGGILILSLLGFSPLACAAGHTMYLFAAGMHHTDLGIDMGWFNYITPGPEAHRWHHSAEPTGKIGTVNFGFVLAIWDILFGTFRFVRGVKPENLGLWNKRMLPDNLVTHFIIGISGKSYDSLLVPTIPLPDLQD
jgi:sterol desaturase/sphingolipid hydroxylase (fatty acid hydroxylase superfamily)